MQSFANLSSLTKINTQNWFPFTNRLTVKKKMTNRCFLFKWWNHLYVGNLLTDMNDSWMDVWFANVTIVCFFPQNMVEKLHVLGEEPENKIEFGTPIRYTILNIILFWRENLSLWISSKETSSKLIAWRGHYICVFHWMFFYRRETYQMAHPSIIETAEEDDFVPADPSAFSRPMKGRLKISAIWLAKLHAIYSVMDK